MAERYYIREKFWSELLNKAREKTKLHSAISPTKHDWLGTGAGKTGLSYSYIIAKHEGRVELYIDRGKDLESENRAIFEELLKSKDTIEEVFGGPLEWDRVEGRRACIIRRRINLGGYRDNEKWSEIHEDMIDAMIRLEQAFRPYIEKISL